MERIRHGHQELPQEVEDHPSCGQADREFSCPHDGEKARPPREGRLGHVAQARGADDAVVVFRDTFAAEEASALRAAGHGFAEGVVETALVEKRRHGWAGGGVGAGGGCNGGTGVVFFARNGHSRMMQYPARTTEIVVVTTAKVSDTGS